MTPSETARINRLLGLIAMVAALMAIALPGEPATGSSTREAAAVVLEPSAEEAGDSMTNQQLSPPLGDSAAAAGRPDSGRVGRAPFYGGSPIPLAPPKRPVKHRRPAPNQPAGTDSTATDSTKADSSMEGLVCFQ